MGVPAQAPSSGTPPGGAIRGVVYDSLVTRAPLAGAEVWVDGLVHEARTDAAGRFVIDGVPPGRHRVSFSHPALARLRFGAPVGEVAVVAGGAAEVRLVTPSPATVYAALCPAPRDVKTGVLLGTAEADDSGAAPAAGAELTAAWSAIVVGEQGLVRAERTVRALTDSAGVYRLCGVPTDVPVHVRAAAGAAVAAEEVDLEGRLVGVQEVRLPTGAAPPTASSTDAGTATVAGVVRRADGRPAAGARIGIVGAAGVAATAGDDGRFVLRGASAGAQVIEARLVGVRPSAVAVLLAAGRTTRVALTLGERVNVLAATTVRGRRLPDLLAGFEARRRLGAGHFVTAEEMRVRGVVTIFDALVGVPGVHVTPGRVPGPPAAVRVSRALGQIGVMADSCPPLFFVDGVRQPAGADVPLSVGDLYGLEVHTGLSSAPAQFQQTNSGCGVILAWTKRGAAR